jgi:hypothetical protein
MTETGASENRAQHYRDLLNGTDDTGITTADVRFPREGVHTYHLNDSVTFRDKYKRVHTGPITRFERVERKIYATVQADGIGMVLAVSHLLPAEHPDAVAMAAPATHLPCGTVVRVKQAKGKTYGGIADGGLGVVLADKIDLVNVAKLGGEPTSRGDSYGKFSHASLTVVPLNEIGQYL